MAPSAMARLMASSAVTKVCAARLWQSMQSIDAALALGLRAVERRGGIRGDRAVGVVRSTQGIVVRVGSVAMYSMWPRCTPWMPVRCESESSPPRCRMSTVCDSVFCSSSAKLDLTSSLSPSKRVGVWQASQV